MRAQRVARRISRPALAGALLVLLLAPGLAAATEGHVETGGKLDGPLRGRMARAGAASEGSQPLVVEASDIDALRAHARDAGLDLRVRGGSRIATVQATLAQARMMAGWSEVVRVGEDRAASALGFIGDAAEAMAVPEARAAYAVSGDGDGDAARFTRADSTIAILDTGIDAAHPDLVGKVVGWKDLVNGRTDPYDDNGHGTHVASIAAGKGVADPRYAGVAPGAALVGVKVLNAQGSGSTATIAQGIEWVVQNRALFGIRVLSMSLGARDPDCAADGTDFLSQKVDWAFHQGVLVTVAAGNDGPSSCLLTPGVARDALTVGSIRDPAEGGFIMSLFSSRGPTGDGRIKPDLVAPGDSITAAHAGGGYVSMRGTSMATPFVAGSAALLFAARPTLTPAEARDLLTGTALDLGAAGLDDESGAGAVQPFAALRALRADDRAVPLHPMVANVHGHVAHQGAQSLPLVVPLAGGVVGASLTFPLANAPWSSWCAGTNASPDLDLEVHAPDGSFVAGSASAGCREEAVAFTPRVPGTYTLTVRSDTGASDFDLSTSVPQGDAAPPRVSVRVLTANIHENSAVTLRAQASDDVGVIALQGGLAFGETSQELAWSDLGNGVWEAQVSASGAGAHTITVQAWDAAGHVGVGTAQFDALPGRLAQLRNATVDVLGPSVALVRWDTDVPALGRVLVEAGTASRTFAERAAGLTHNVTLTGLRAGSSVRITPQSSNVVGVAGGEAFSVTLPTDPTGIVVVTDVQGRAARVQATLTGADGALAGRAVLLSIDGLRVAARTDALGQVTWSGLLDPGGHNVQARFASEAGYRGAQASARIAVAPVNTTVILLPTTSGTRAALAVQLVDGQGEPVGSQSVRLTVGRATVTVRTDAGGAALVALPIPAGEYTANATFGGGRGYNASAASVPATWTPIVPALTLDAQDGGAGKVLARVHAEANGGPIAGARIALLVDGVARATVTTSGAGDGTANLRLAPGQHDITARLSAVGSLVGPTEAAATLTL